MAKESKNFLWPSEPAQITNDSNTFTANSLVLFFSKKNVSANGFQGNE